MNVPPVCSVECWSSEMMLAPARVRNVVTAATSPGRSAQRSNSRPMSLTGNELRHATENSPVADSSASLSAPVVIVLRLPSWVAPGRGSSADGNHDPVISTGAWLPYPSLRLLAGRAGRAGCAGESAVDREGSGAAGAAVGPV